MERTKLKEEGNTENEKVNKSGKEEDWNKQVNK
jgi:hypothetical protein